MTMSRKAWLITATEGHITRTVDVVPARRKIDYLDHHLSDLYSDLYEGDFEDMTAFVTHPSGREVVLDKHNGRILKAELTEVDEDLYAQYQRGDDDGEEW